jgi:vWA-MoxR associated protein C-terminal domain/Effector-associated domain 1
VAIDWGDNTNRKAFREALQSAYPNASELEIFVDEELNENLAVVAGGDNLQVTAHGFVKWAMARDRINEVYVAFKQQNPKHPVIERLERQSFISQKFNLASDDWDTLFGLFLPDDLADLKRAFNEGFQRALGLTFQQARPDHSVLNDLAQICELLKIYDTKNDEGPVLAVRFAECAIVELHRSSEGTNRDLKALEQWCDRVSQQHNVPKQAPKSTPTTACHAYLLVAFEEMGSNVNVYPELHITGVENPIRFGAQPTTCSIDKVADQIGQWINQAEGMPEICQCESSKVILELFLPYKLLEEDIGTHWKVRDEWEDTINLEDYRYLLVRSSDRILKTKLRESLILNWKQLERDVEAGNGCIKFHHQAVCLERGKLPALLEDHKATGLKLTAKLPVDRGDRHDVLKDIVKAAIPIALWSSETTETEAANLKTEFDSLLKCRLTNFADLARQWRICRRDGSQIAKHIRLLCDHPHRMPKPPNPDQEEDLLVAS